MQAGNPFPKAIRVILVLVGIVAVFIGLVQLIEFCSVLSDDSEYHWGTGGCLPWQYASEATYLFSLAVEILLYGTFVWLVFRALRYSGLGRLVRALTVLTVAILSTWSGITKPFVDLLASVIP